jgi:hypothetical protein
MGKKTKRENKKQKTIINVQKNNFFTLFQDDNSGGLSSEGHGLKSLLLLFTGLFPLLVCADSRKRALGKTVWAKVWML